MGITKAAVHYRFRTKAQILQASLDSPVEEMAVLLDELAGMTSRQEKMEAYAVGWVDFLVRNRALGAMPCTIPRSGPPASTPRATGDGDGPCGSCSATRPPRRSAWPM